MTHTTPTGGGYPLPQKLTLVFSKAADAPRINKLFDPTVKDAVDPNAYVVKRDKAVMDHHIAGGHAGMLVDEKGDVKTLTIAWHAKDANGNHRYTEVGTSLATLPGYHSAHPLISALVLKEWWAHKPYKGIIAEILVSNAPSGKAYRDTMKWQDIQSSAVIKDIEKHCNANITEDLNTGEPYNWLRCGRPALQAQAKILLDYLDHGCLHNKKGDTIPLDLSALDKAGLTRPRLEAIAKGNINRHALALL